MLVVSANTIVADIAAEFDLTPTEASLYLDDLLDESDDFESSDVAS